MGPTIIVISFAGSVLRDEPKLSAKETTYNLGQNEMGNKTSNPHRPGMNPRETQTRQFLSLKWGGGGGTLSKIKMPNLQVCGHLQEVRHHKGLNFGHSLLLSQS